MNLGHLESIRSNELDHALSKIRHDKSARNTVLEIGAGTGHQARRMSEKGYKVVAIDIAGSYYSEDRIWPILDYDGTHIPFPDSYFDIVYSSSVLEHIVHLDAFLDEIKRVLKTDGIAIHILPSGTWRLWTNFAHYAFILKTLTYGLYNKLHILQKRQYSEHLPKVHLTVSILSKRHLLPLRHGDTGTAFSEIYYFSKQRWYSTFTNNKWDINTYFTNRLFYSGYGILNSAISIQFRRYLSYLLGSSCHIFVLTKKRNPG